MKPRNVLVTTSFFHFFQDGFVYAIFILLPAISNDFELSFSQAGMLKFCLSGVASILQIPAVLIAEKVGRSLHRIPKSSQLSFIQQKEGKSVLSSFDLTTQNIQTRLQLPEGVQDVAWLASGTLIFAQGNTLFQWDPNTSSGIQVWKKLSGINSISRLALSPNGKLLALVGNE